jgi:hypothetical protein
MGVNPSALFVGGQAGYTVPMTNADHQHPGLSEKGKASQEERAGREAQALRENLRRRKAQGEGRKENSSEDSGNNSPGEASA